MRSTSTELPDMYVVLPTGLQFSLMSCSRYFQVRLVFRLHGRSLWQGRRFVSGLVPLPYEVHQYLATGISALLPIYFHRAGCAFPFYVVCMILIGLDFYTTDIFARVFNNSIHWCQPTFSGFRLGCHGYCLASLQV